MLPTQMMKYLDYIFKVFFSVFSLELTPPPAVSVTSVLAHESLCFVTEGETAGPEPPGWSSCDVHTGHVALMGYWLLLNIFCL